MIQLRILRRGNYPGLSDWMRYVTTGVLAREVTLAEEEEAMWSWRGGDTGVVKLQVRDCRQPPEDGRDKEQILPWSLQGKQDPDDTLIPD